MPHRTFFGLFSYCFGNGFVYWHAYCLQFFQSLHIETEQVLVEVENCDPFGCKKEIRVDVEASKKLEENPSEDLMVSIHI